MSAPQIQPDSSVDNSMDRLEIEMTDFVADHPKVMRFLRGFYFHKLLQPLMFCFALKGTKSSSTSDLLAWCQIKTEVHQREKAMLNAHISQLNETIFNLNAVVSLNYTPIYR